MAAQVTNFANVPVEDIPPCVTYRCMPHWGMSWRSPVKYKSLSGEMEYHYILEWDLVTPYGVNMIREEYFGDKVISSSYTLTSEGITEVNYSEGPAYWLKYGQVCKQGPKEEQTQQSSTDEKLDTLNAKLDELLAKFPGSYALDTGPIEADNGGTPLRYFGAMPDTPAVSVEDFGAKADWDGVSGTDNTQAFQAAVTYTENKDAASSQYIDKLIAAQKANESLPIYEGAYLNADALTSEHVFVDGEVFLIMNDSKTGAENRRRRVGKGTEIVHLVDYVSIAHYGPLNMSTEWSVLPEDALVHGEDGEKTFLRAGTRFKVLDYAGVFNGGEINPGTLAVQYADCIYPSL